MATYLKPSQNLSWELPNEGEIFRTPSSSDPNQGEIFKRQGNALLRLGEQQFRGANNARVRLGDILPQYGINFGSIREVSPEAVDILQNKLGHTLKQGTLEDFRTSAPQNLAERYTETAQDQNPLITSNTGSVSRPTPSPITSTGYISGQAPIEQGQMNYQTNALTGALGSADRTNQLLQMASQRTGIPARTFQNQPNQLAPMGQQTPMLPQIGGGGSAGGMGSLAGAMGTTGVTGGVPTESLSDQYFKQLLESLKPSTAETDTQQKLNDLVSQQAGINASRDLGIQAVGEQPIATPFLSGMSKAITERAATQLGALSAQAMPLQQRLAQDIAKRQASIDVTKAYLERETAKEKEKREGAYTLGEGQQRYDASGKLIASGAPKSATNLDTSVVDIGGRRLLINNQTGATIKDLGAATKTGNPVLDALREFELEQKTKATPGQVVNATTGYPAKLTDIQSQFLSQGQVLRQLNQEIKDAIGNIGTNALKGWVTEKGYLVPVVQDKFVNNPAVLDLMQKMYSLNNLFVYFSTGKQINETEFTRLAKQTPNFRATSEYNESALNNFENNIRSRMDNYLRLNGWKINQGQSNEQGNDPLGIR